MPPSARHKAKARAEGSFLSAIWSACALLGIAGVAGAVHSAFVFVPVRLLPASGSLNASTTRPLGDPGSGGSSSTRDAEIQTGARSGTATGTAPVPPTPDVPEGRLSLEDAYLQWEMGTFFLDARDAAAYAAGHVEGAMHLNREMLRHVGSGLDLIQSLPPEAPLVIYCTGGDCHDAENVAIELQQLHGFTNVVVMQAGYDEWLAAGYPTTTGESP